MRNYKEELKLIRIVNRLVKEDSFIYYPRYMGRKHIPVELQRLVVDKILTKGDKYEKL